MMMKKRLTALLAALALLLSLCACGQQKAPAEANDPAPAEKPETSSTVIPVENPKEPVSEAVPEADPLQVYGATLDRYYERIIAGGELWDAGEGETGVLEVIAQGVGLDDIGYAILDLSGDGTPELLIGGLAQHGTQGYFGSDLYAVYAAPEGVPILTCEGWSRDSLHWLGGNRFLRTGSSGAMYSMFGTYALSDDAAALNCEDFWFTYEKDDSYTEMAFYQNSSGMWDPAMSRELDMTAEDFRRLEEEMEEQVRAVELTPFSVYEPSGGTPVKAQWAAEALGAYTAYDAFTADTSDARTRGLFIAAGDGVKDFRLLALELEVVSETGAMTFSAREVYQQDALTPERPLAVEMTFYGDIPNYGIACVDGSGAEQRFVLEISGADGSLLLREADGHTNGKVTVRVF